MPSYNVRDLLLTQVVAGDNDRTVFDEQEIAQLAASIAADGLAQPITVRPHPTQPDLFEIVAGERRTRACRSLGFVTIPAIVRNLSDEQASAIMLAENLHRSDLNPMDEARAYQKRIDQFGWSPAELARKAKRSARHVQARLALLSLLPQAQQMIQSGQLAAGWGEPMAMLDQNRQRIALRYLTSTDRPLLREFQAICGRLQSEQAQEVMFDPDEFLLQTVEAHTEAEQERRDRGGRFPVAPGLPEFRRCGTVSESLEHYIAALMASDDPQHREAAGVVGVIYQGMLKAGFCFAPRRKTPLDNE